MLKIKKRKSPKIVEISDKNTSKTSVFKDGCRTLKQLIAPSSIELTSEHELKVENNYARSFAINAYPARVSINWMDNIYSYDGDIDVATYVEPSLERDALDELTDNITKYQTQYQIEMEKGSNKNTTYLEEKIKALYEQRRKLEQNYESMFHVSTFCSIYRSDLKLLNKETQKFQSRINGNRMSVMPLLLRQDDGFKTVSPFGILTIPDYARNMNTGALSTMFPFYNSEVNHKKGTFIAINRMQKTPVIIDFFNRDLLPNSNLLVFGVSGIGKTYFMSILLMRAGIEGVRHVILDPEDEYGKCTEATHGVSIDIVSSMLNVFDIDKEMELDKEGNPTGKYYVDIKAKTSELLNLFSVMFPGEITSDIKADFSAVIMGLYESREITADPESLYEEKTDFDEEKGIYFDKKALKQMPTMTDFRNALIEYNDIKQSAELEKLINALSIYCKGGVYDMFDCLTNEEIQLLLETAMTIRFVINVEDEVLRPILMYVVMTWTENKFIRKDLATKKRIVCDEAWLLLKHNMPGSKYTSLFLEKCARRIRKYNGSLCCVSQQFREFTSREEGLAILSNSAVKIFMRQESEDIENVVDKFILSNGEKDFLLTAQKGEILVKVARESFIADVFAFPFEDALISKKYLKNT